MNLNEFYRAASKELLLTTTQIQKVVRTAPFRYKHYSIAKRNGGRRDIHHPSPVLKALQRWLVRGPLSTLPVHDSVYSYRIGRNIAMNANVHIRSNYFSRFDFEAFFPSINNRLLTDFMVSAAAKGHIALDAEAIKVAARLACRATETPDSDVLSVGAPSSPLISNALLFDFDQEVAEAARRVGGSYTRYADDCFLSTQSISALESLEQEFRLLVRERLPFLRLNEKKHQHFSRRRRVTITGVNITSDRKLSVGRETKRAIRTRLHLAISGRLPPEEHPSLRGSIAYVMSIEPEFIERLRSKYGERCVLEFMEFSNPIAADAAGNKERGQM
jgi:RNA-directed DNA polymerase